MQKAIGYVRISTKDQSNFSLEGQEKSIRDFAEKNNYNLLAVFKDDGKSAKNFDRPDWKALEKFIKENHSEVSFLIVMKYDRFSRNVADALQMMEHLENRYAIRVMSSMEPIMLHPKSPYFFQFRTQMLLGAQVEWLVIRDRTKFGMQQAAKNGRYVCGAPFGYLNTRDLQNKPLLKIDPVKALVVKKIFEMFLQGAPFREIQLQAAMGGYKNKGKSAVRRTLENPLYAGLVNVPEYYDEPAKLVKAIHEPIVAEADWWQVHHMLHQKESQKKVILNENVPLRGVLKCFCGHLLTAGASKGKTTYVWYYKCNKHPKYNLNAGKAHIQMEEIMKTLSLPAQYTEYLQEKTKELIEANYGESAQLIAQKKDELRRLYVKTENLEAKFMDDDIDKQTFKKWKLRYQEEISIIEKTLLECEEADDLWERYSENLSKLSDLHFLYSVANIQVKQALLRIGFNNSLYYQDGSYRTQFMLPFFELKAPSLKEKGLLVLEKPPVKSAKNQQCTPDGN